MSNKRKNRKHIPKYKDSADMMRRIGTRLAFAETANMPIDPDGVVTLSLKMRAARDALAQGVGTIDHVSTLTAEVNLTQQFCRANFCDAGAHTDVVQRAHNAIGSIGARHYRTGKWGVSGPELLAINDLIELREAIYSHESNTVGFERQAQVAVAKEVEKGNVIRIYEDVEEGMAA
jgi:hypothetical protein